MIIKGLGFYYKCVLCELSEAVCMHTLHCNKRARLHAELTLSHLFSCVNDPQKTPFMFSFYLYIIPKPALNLKYHSKGIDQEASG